MSRLTRILVVDDEPHILRMLKVLLSKHGYDVTVAIDGGDGLQRVRADRPDIVVLDANMPVFDGYELCRRIRDDESLSPQPYVLMLTAGGQAKDAEKAATAGVDEFMTKPFSPVQFAARLAEIQAGRA